MVKEKTRVWRKGKLRFNGGWERSLLHDIDPDELLMDMLKERVRLNRRIGDVTIVKEIEGHLLQFTQRQSRSLLFHVKEVPSEAEQIRSYFETDEVDAED